MSVQTGKNGYLFLLSGFFCTNLIGYAVNVFILSKNYILQEQESIVWVDNSGVLLSRFEDFFKLFGFTSGMELFSVGGIASGIGLLIALLIGISACILLRNYSRISDNDQFLILVCICAFVLNGFVLSYMNHDYSVNYWLPIMVYAWIAVYLLLKYNFKDLSGVMALILSLCVTICSLCTVRHSVVQPFWGSYQLYTISQKLRELCLRKGCSAFWSSDNITEMTDGEIEMWTIEYNPEDMSMTCYPWLQKTSHLSFPEDQYFILLPTDFDVRAICESQNMNLTDFFTCEDYSVAVIN